jgi:L-2-hydroxyglutarate oxidase LhgO
MRADCLILGGGIIGLMTAREIVRKYPDWDVAVLEKSHYFGDGATGRNSGVLHSGIYYEYGSLKHRLCMEGNRLWRSEPSAIIWACGKMIVGDDLSELSKRAIQNDVRHRKATAQELLQLNHFTKASEAIFVHDTAVLDIGRFIREIVVELTEMGVSLVPNFEDTGLPPANWTINCAGFGAIDVRTKLGFKGYSQKLVKGRWMASTYRFEAPWLIYPKPLPNLLGLGVHSCIEPDGSVRFGPDTVPVDRMDYSFGDASELAEAIVQQFPGVPKSSLRPSTVGIRTKLNEATDFVIQSPEKGYAEALGIESPGLTAAPAIAKMLSSLV